jgi:hypothetical protein
VKHVKLSKHTSWRQSHTARSQSSPHVNATRVRCVHGYIDPFLAAARDNGSP